MEKSKAWVEKKEKKKEENPVQGMRAGVEVGYTQAAASLTNRLTPQSIF